MEAALDDFREKPMYTAPLAIALNFYLGLRNGELVVLNEKDIQGNYIHIQREEISKFRVEDGKRVKDGFAVKDYKNRRKATAGCTLLQKPEKSLIWS